LLGSLNTVGPGEWKVFEVCARRILPPLQFYALDYHVKRLEWITAAKIEAILKNTHFRKWCFR
jgi:hypothetical protein